MIAQAKNTNTLIHTSAVHGSTLNSERKFFYQKSLQDLTLNYLIKVSGLLFCLIHRQHIARVHDTCRPVWLQPKLTTPRWVLHKTII
jgi:hypothetical protein